VIPSWRVAQHSRPESLLAIRWGEMKPIDVEGEDTSLTQEQLELLR